MDSEVFERDKHVFFLEMMYQLLPHHYQTQEINRLTLAYFVVSGLNLLASLDRVSDSISPQTRHRFGFRLLIAILLLD